MSNISKINCVVAKVFEIAADYNIDVLSDLSTNIVTGNRELVFNFRKNEKRADVVIDVSRIYLVKEIDLIVNNILEGKEKLPSNSGKIIRIIIKNMILKNKNNEEIENIVINILEHTYGNNFNRAYWKKIIASMIKDLKSKNIKMIDIDNI